MDRGVVFTNLAHRSPSRCHVILATITSGTHELYYKCTHDVNERSGYNKLGNR